MFKAACTNNPGYIDHLIILFMKFKNQRSFVYAITENNPTTNVLMVISLE